MAESMAEILEMLKQSQQQNAELMQRLMNQQGNGGNSIDQRMKNICDLMSCFTYDPENNLTFEVWFNRHSQIFTSGAAEDLNDANKIQLILQKFTDADYHDFADSILPKKPEEMKFDDVVKLLRKKFSYKETRFAIRHKCFSLSKLDTEDHKKYAARINKHGEKFDIKKCSVDDFKILLYVSGLKSNQESHILEKLLSKIDNHYIKVEAAQDSEEEAPKLTLDDLVSEAERLISLKKDKGLVSEPSTSTSSEVLSLQTQAKIKYSKNFHQDSGRTSPTKSREQKPFCKYCGEFHLYVDCKYRSKECEQCKSKGHRTGFCHVSKMTNLQSKSKRNSGQVNTIETSTNSKRKFITPDINGIQIKMQIDTASDITIISYENWKRLGKPTLSSCDIKPGSASGDIVNLKGYFEGKFKLQGKKSSGKCYVAGNLNLLGIDWITEFDLWNVPLATVCNIIQTNQDIASLAKSKYPNLFAGGLGCCNKTKMSLTLKAGARPVYRKPRSVPFAAAAKIEQELKRLQHLNVITPVEFSEFAAPIVVVKKNDNRIRLCGDYSTGLNENLESNCFPIPTPEQIFAKLSGMKVFSVIDFSDAFLQIEADDESKKMLTITTHCGLFKVNRMQPGIKPAPGMFQELMSKMLSGTRNSYAFMDDIIVAGTDVNDHKRELFDVLNRIQDYGFKLQIEKCKIGRAEVKFCGHIINGNLIFPDPADIQETMEISKPTNVKEVQSFLGSVNYYNKFIKNFSNMRAPLDELTKKDVKFIWESKHDEAFSEIKKIMNSKLVLTHYDPNKKLVVAADASSYGIGASLMHEFSDGSLHPIIFASSSLNPAEKNYSQIEREALALVFAVKKFHYYIYGRRFKLQTDHKPLLAIFGSKSGIPAYTASRLQRYALRLLAYDFEIEYVKTDSFGYVDVISRLMKNHERTNEDTVIASIRTDEMVQCFAIETAMKLPIKFVDIKEATGKCNVLSEVMKLIENGWPPTAKKIANDEVKKFFNVRHQLMKIEDCIFYGDRIVIPTKYRSEIINELHTGHPGIVRMKLLARKFTFWPKIDDDIESFVKRCDTCAKNTKSPIKCELKSWPMPTEPWNRLHIDYAGPKDGFYFLVIVDAYSRWPEVFKTQCISASKTVQLVDEALTRQGLCDTIVCDNGTQFTSQEFRNYCQAQGIEIIYTAPYHPQSDGQGEKFVDLLKTGLDKATGNVDAKLQKFLTCYRYTPSYNLGMKSPCELLNNRMMKTKLNLLLPKSKSMTNSQKESMEMQFNAHHGAKWKSFEIGDEVYYKHHKANKQWDWAHAKILDKIGSVNYKIEFEAPMGTRIVKAHANQLKQRHSPNEILDAFGLTDIPDEVELTINTQPATRDESEDDSEVEDENGSDQSNADETHYEDALNDSADAETTENRENEENDVRRETRTRRVPKTLSYDKNFNQIEL